MDSVIRVAVDGVVPLMPPTRQSRAVRRIVGQILMITYPYWLLEYRRVASWSFAIGISRDMWPGRLLAEYRSRLAWLDRARLWTLYLGSTVAGLFIPKVLFGRVQMQFADFLRRRRQSLFRSSYSPLDGPTSQSGLTP